MGFHLRRKQALLGKKIVRLRGNFLGGNDYYYYIVPKGSEVKRVFFFWRVWFGNGEIELTEIPGMREVGGN